MNNYRVSVTALNTFHMFLEHGDDEFDQSQINYYDWDHMIASFRRDPVSLEQQKKMDCGTMCHKFMELGKWDVYGLAKPDDIIAEVRDNLSLLRSELYNAGENFEPLKDSKIYTPDGCSIEVIGILDSYNALSQAITDYKTTSRIDITKYYESFQHKFYFEIFGGNKFIYQVIDLNTGNIEEHIINKENRNELDCTLLVSEFKLFLDLNQDVQQYFIMH